LRHLILCFSAIAVLGAGQNTARRIPESKNVELLSDGVRVTVGPAFLTLKPQSDTIVRVLYSRDREPRVDDMVVVGPKNSLGAGQAPPAPKWDVKSTATAVTLSTAKLRVTVSLADGAVTFADAAGRPILEEVAGAHTLTPATVQGESTQNVRQVWRASAGESLYGLGQRQEGKLDIKGYDLELWQRNTVVEIPFLVSSRGYGILWDNTSFTKFGDIRPFEPIPAANLIDAKGQPGGLSQGTFVAGSDDIQDATTTASIQPAPGGRGRGAAGGGSRGWLGEIVAPVTGDYQFQTYSNLDIKVWLDRQLRIDHWKQSWATENDQFKVHLEAGKRYPIKIVSSPGATLRVAWKTPAATPDTSLWSEVGEAVDYYFVYGPELDQVVAGYRTLTGQASMLPHWAFGFWQSKNKYNTQDEVLKTLAEFRRRQIPLDSIVQDWQYWKPDSWGTHEFEASRYPDPDGMIRAIHDSHARFMISVWGKFYPQTENSKALAAINGLYLPTLTAGTRDWLQRNYVFYDAFNAPARTMFWDQVNKALFSKGVDAWWMDATEPDIVQPSPPTLDALRRDIDKTAIGTASRVMNAYSLANSEAVYDGQRRVAPDQRVFILTRSGFAGIQRYGTVTWSGDITSEWTTLRKQITAGLGFSIAGDPYWTTDTGGYTMQGRFTNARDGDALDEWRELNARWFQYSTFSPILRVHGTDRPREMWNLGDETTAVYQSELKFDKLRYALFPYIYAVAGAVTQDGYTMMRPLVMDFRGDVKARDITDEFMFGPSLLVSPVTEYKARSRHVYLPAGSTWYNFWTGAALVSGAGGQTIMADAPYDQIPVFVRAGSIVPFGPDQQYIGEKDARALTLYVYAGANGQFSLYEDDGVTYGYEKRQFSRIPISWDEATRTLTVGRRVGSFTGMVTDRTFNVVLVSPGTPAGYQPSVTNSRPVAYRGGTVAIKF
jgi:alpha-D-xyloside xylohydrolase